MTMRLNKTTIDGATNRAQRRQKVHRQIVSDLTNDPGKETRIRRCICPSCYYISADYRKTWQQTPLCEECYVTLSKEVEFGHWCLTCATKFQVCHLCGADLELTHRRKAKR